MTHDLRICFVGDSYVAGLGDPRFLGWAGRLAARTIAAGRPLTGYNLGVRRQTSADVLARFRSECGPRLAPADDPRVVLSVGVNDATHEDGRPRVTPDESSANLGRLLDQAAAEGWSVLVVAPPPVADPGHQARTALLDREFARICRAAGVPYAPVHQPLAADPTWIHEVRTGDGAHPAEAGYDALADLIAPHWDAWLDSGR
ncbi:GDSL-type esterase/lipase family protein [Kitasatospora sp. NBC_00070]|uniref:GDSL-type esterase/lipase family protein n=1 Tax=Kitasatospora sp. NBC_00070 TaxID=2975962 RepID=UPI0032543FA9